MAAQPAFLKAYKNLVEKPGEATHTAKWDRCVEEVKAKGGGADPYAVCTAMLGDDSFKAMNDDDFVKEVDEFLHKLGIAGAGPVPSSLLSRQDLERSTRKSSAILRKSDSDHEMTIEIHNGSEEATKDGSSSISVVYHDLDGNEKCEVYTNGIDAAAAEARLKEAGFKDVKCITSAEKAGDVCWVIRTNGMEYARFYAKNEAEECLAMLTSQGQFAVMVREEVVAEKGAVEQTGKQLANVVRQAAKAESTEEKDDLVTNLKAIQLKRQKATIQARTKAARGSFKEVWGGLNKNAD